jgi:5-methylcytosine-specific restriction protein A
MLVFRRITSADFFNIYKERGAEEGGGGQSYIDIDTSGVSIPDWHNFFSGISPTAKMGGPLWTFQVHSLGTGSSQTLKIGQRRSSSVSIREQKLDSLRSNRVHAWHPAKTGFPSPKGKLSSSADPQIAALIKGLVIFIIRATDGTYWAGWMREQNRPLTWSIPPVLDPLFVNDDGFIRFLNALDFDETNLHWPFIVPAGAPGAAPSGPAPSGAAPSGPAPSGPAPSGTVPASGSALPNAPSQKQPKFREMTEAEAASTLFDADYSAAPPAFKEVITKIRERNQKAARALKDLYGECQITGSKFSFKKADGKPYLEVHHLIPLGLGGADAPANLVVVSAHIHRMLHYAEVTGLDLTKISGNELAIEINGEAHVIRWRSDHVATIIDAG